MAKKFWISPKIGSIREYEADSEVPIVEHSFKVIEKKAYDDIKVKLDIADQIVSLVKNQIILKLTGRVRQDADELLDAYYDKIKGGDT